jgi:hypothetical protein
MAKYRHRIFEMYEFLDEAARALTPRSNRSVTEAAAQKLGTFKRLVVTRSGSATLVEFKLAEDMEEVDDGELGKEFVQLADNLARDSKILIDFTGVKSFGTASIEVLVQFNQNVKIKGCRIALCCLDPVVRQSFF